MNTTFVTAIYNLEKGAEHLLNFVGDHVRLIVFSTGEIFEDIKQQYSYRKNILFLDIPWTEFVSHPYEPYVLEFEKPHLVNRAMQYSQTTHYCWLDVELFENPRVCSILHNFAKSGVGSRTEHELYRVGKKVSILQQDMQLKVIFAPKVTFLSFIQSYFTKFKKRLYPQNWMKEWFEQEPERFESIGNEDEPESWMNVFWRSDLSMHTPMLKGGLGNQMFQVAAIYGISRRRNETFILDPRVCYWSTASQMEEEYIQTVFQRFVIAPAESPLCYTQKEEEQEQEKYSLNHEYFEESKCPESILYTGYFMNYHYFEPYVTELRKLFVFPETAPMEVYFIHFRFGDNVKNGTHQVDLKHYYLRCLDRLQGHHVKIHVFSDEPLSAEKYIQENLSPYVGMFTFVETKNELEALAQMTNCTLGGICANSTFSWWGAMLNTNPQKKIYFPSRMYPQGSVYDCDISGMLHPSFEIVSVEPPESKNPWSFFKEVYVINLEHRKDRREHIRNHFSKFEGLEYSFFRAVNGREAKYLSQYAIQRGIVQPEKDEDGLSMSHPQIACLMSHYLIWQQVLLRVPNNSSGFWILILEDDIEFHPQFTNDVLQEYLDKLPSEARLFKMVYMEAQGYSKVSSVNSHWNKLEKKTFSTMGYAVHTDLLIHLLLNVYKHPIDWYPIHQAYGFKDIHLDGNSKDAFFNYVYVFEKDKALFQYNGTYSGVARSYNQDKDSDINFFTREVFQVKR